MRRIVLIVLFLVILIAVVAAVLPFDLYCNARYRQTGCLRRTTAPYRGCSSRVRDCDKVGIPPMFHQTWKTQELLPFQQRNRTDMQLSLPTVDCRLHVDADFDPFVRQHFEWFWPTWQLLTPFIKRVDCIRYMWLWVYGGTYCDLDVTIEDRAAWQQFMQRRYPRNTVVLLSCSSNTALLTTTPTFLQSTAPHHPLWLMMLHHIQQNRHQITYRCTGPWALTKVARQFLRRPIFYSVDSVVNNNVDDASALPQLALLVSASDYCKQFNDDNTTADYYICLASMSQFGIMPANPLVHRICNHTGSYLWADQDEKRNS